MFHVKNGLFFERIDASKLDKDHAAEFYGGVRILVTKDGKEGSPVVFEQMLTAEAWASVVASMTVLGESGATFRMMVALQKG